MRKHMLGRRVLACLCSVAMACALVPAVAVSAFAADTDGGSVLTPTVVGQAVGGKKSGVATGFSMGNDAAYVTGGAIAKMKSNSTGAGTYWFKVFGTVAGTGSGSASNYNQWAWTFDSSTCTLSTSDRGAYSLPVSTTSSSAKTTTVTIDTANTNAFPCEATVSFPVEGYADGVQLTFSDGNGGIYNGLVSTDLTYSTGLRCDLPGITKSATYTVTSDQTYFSVYLRNTATGEKTLAKSWTKPELEALASTDAEGRGFLAKSTSTWQVYSSREWVTLSNLLNNADASACWKPGSTIKFYASDGAYGMNVPSYDTVMGGMWYPNTGVSTTDASDGVSSEPIISLTDYKGSRDLDVTNDLAKKKLAAEMADTNSGNWRSTLTWYQGVTAADYANSSSNNLGGNRFASSMLYMTINYTPTDISSAIVKTSDMTYNGIDQSIAPVVTVGSTTLTAGTDYACTPATVNKAGVYTVKITGKGAYTGTKTAILKVNPTKASPKITVGTDKMAVRYAATGASKYKIYYRVKGTSTWKGVTTTSTKILIKGLKTGKKYQVKVQSIASGVSPTMSGIVTSAKIK